jgi:uncharacterized membrane protein YjfL (UPF0719 family)
MDTITPLMALNIEVDNIVNALIYAALGLVVFGIFWFIVMKVTPFSLQKEIEHDQNTALGIILGSIVIGMALIISAAIHG